MPSPSWNPDQYLRFAAERARPFEDLVARIRTDPAVVVDLGCGPGTVTRTLADRWPHTRIEGIDSSAAMIEKAESLATERLTFRRGDIATWAPAAASVDVIVSNAAFQWVPSHVDALPTFLTALRPGGTLAFQVPAPSPAGDIFRTVAGSPRWRAELGALAVDDHHSSVWTPAEYTDILAGLGATVDAWETTYIHVLSGEDPVLEWYSGTGLRPYTDALGSDRVDAFRDEITAALRTAFPRKAYGTLLPFRRIFVVARTG